MKNECSIVRDLLPLYAERMTSADTADFVTAHLENCTDCQRELEQMKKPHPAQRTDDAAPLQSLRRKLIAKRAQTIALTALFVIALLVSAFAVLDAPVYRPYAEGLVRIEQSGERALLLIFDERVTGFHYTFHDEPDSGFRCCDIEAWSTPWDDLFSRESVSLSTIVTTANEPLTLYYVPNDGTENICLARFDPRADQPLEMDGQTLGPTTLPRLTLGYYLLLAAGALAALIVVRILVRKNQKASLWTERVGLYPAAYIVSHFLVSGANWATYSMSRDFALIVFLSCLLYGALLLAHNVAHLRKEIRKINR